MNGVKLLWEYIFFMPPILVLELKNTNKGRLFRGIFIQWPCLYFVNELSLKKKLCQNWLLYTCLFFFCYDDVNCLYLLVLVWQNCFMFMLIIVVVCLSKWNMVITYILYLFYSCFVVKMLYWKQWILQCVEVIANFKFHLYFIWQRTVTLA